MNMNDKIVKLMDIAESYGVFFAKNTVKYYPDVVRLGYKSFCEYLENTLFFNEDDIAKFSVCKKDEIYYKHKTKNDLWDALYCIAIQSAFCYLHEVDDDFFN